MNERLKLMSRKKRIVAIAIGIGIVLVAGGATYAAMSVMKANESNRDSAPSKATPEQTLEQKADDANAKAKGLMNEISKEGSGAESNEKAKEAVAQFEEAAEQYKQAGNIHDSQSAQANADALANRYATEAEATKKLEAEHAQQRAAIEASKAAMAASNP